MNDDFVRLRERAREGMQSGTLPRRTPAATWGGLGDGRACAVCEQRVAGHELEVEFDVAPITYRMHVSCFRAWESELLGEALPESSLRADEDEVIMTDREPERSVRRSG